MTTAAIQTSEEDIRKTLKGFIIRSINIPDLHDDDDLFESGLVNSLFAVQLTTFIEKKFGLEITADDLDIRNFRSLSAATGFILRKRESTPA
jgi:methoxymalonate biosynthesis acyl carrier protein